MLPPPRARRRQRLRLDHGGLQQVLQLLRRPLHARRGGVAAVRRRARARWRNSPRQGVREVTLLGQNVNAYLGRVDGFDAPADFALLLDYVHEIPGIERIRYTTSHPREFSRSADRCPRAAAEARLARAPAGAGGVGPDPDGDEARLHRHGIPVDRPAPAQRATRHHASRPTSSSAFPARPTRTSSGHCGWSSEVGFDESYLLHLQPPARNARGRPARRHAGRGQAGAAAAAAGADPGAGEGDQRERWSARASACWWKARRAGSRRNWRAAPPTIGWSTSRAAGIDRADGGGRDRRGAGAYPARYRRVDAGRPFSCWRSRCTTDQRCLGASRRAAPTPAAAAPSSARPIARRRRRTVRCCRCAAAPGGAATAAAAGSAGARTPCSSRTRRPMSSAEDFNYLLGIAALDSGRPSQAVLALERVLALNPDTHAGARGDRPRVPRAARDGGGASASSRRSRARNWRRKCRTPSSRYLAIIARARPAAGEALERRSSRVRSATTAT